MKNHKKGWTRTRVAALSPLFATCAAGVVLTACGGDDESASESVAPVVALKCDNSMMTEFKPDANTTVTLVKAFKKGIPWRFPQRQRHHLRPSQ